MASSAEQQDGTYELTVYGRYGAALRARFQPGQSFAHTFHRPVDDVLEVVVKFVPKARSEDEQ